MTMPRPIEESLAAWRRTVDDVVHGYALTYDDYLQDLDVRHALATHQASLEASTELEALDARFLEHSYPSGECVWGEETAAAEAWDRERHWYYWRLPKGAGPAFDGPSQHRVHSITPGSD
jgi:hypothetical protein